MIGMCGRRWRMRRAIKRELRTVDDHHRVGLGCNGGRRRAVDAAQQPRQPPQNGADAHYGHLADRELRDQPLGGHVLATHAQVADAPAPLLVQRGHQLGAQRVAGMLTRHHEQAQVLPLGGNHMLVHACPTPVTLTPRTAPRMLPETGHVRRLPGLHRRRPQEPCPSR